MPPSALETRVTALEGAVNKGLDEIKELIHDEIQELKNEQLKEIKASIDRVERDVREENKRLADDQRRLWDAVRALEADRNANAGAAVTKRSYSHVITGLLSGGGVAFIAWLLGRIGLGPHP
jgi:hypothetical protein